MLIATILVGAVVLLGSMLLYTRTRPLATTPTCPTCEADYLILEPPDEGGVRRTYDVLVCPECTNAITRVQGTKSRFAWCPACRQRTLETPVRRLPPAPLRPLAVEVEEQCHVCGFRATIELPDGPLELPQPALPDNVIPFRRKG